MPQIRQQAIGKIDAGAPTRQRQKCAARGQARHRKLPNGPRFAFRNRPGQGGRAQLAGHVETVTRSEGIPAKSPTPGHPAQHMDRQARLGCPGQVSTHQGAAMDLGLSQEPTQDAIEACEFQAGRRGQGQAEAQWTRPHGRQVREVGHKSPSPHRHRRLLPPAKVHVFHHGVGARHQVLARARAQDGRVIADTQNNPGLVQAARHTGDAIDQSPFAEIGKRGCP